jgi:DNA-directed RNA polymerase II subunit RPB1
VNDIKHALSIKNNKSRFNFVYREGMKEKKCSRCNSENHNYRKETPLAIDYEIMDRNFPKPNNDPKQLLWPEEAKRILDKISDYHLKVMGLNKETSNPANMIIENLAIAPPPVRPSVAMANSFRSEDDLTVAYKQIIQQNNIIIDAIEKGNTDTSIKEMRKKL